MSASHSEFRPLARRQRQQRRGGFTLVELLVVVGILVLLASILIPVVSRARSQATRTSCVNAMRNLGLAVIAFAGEHAGTTPTAGNDLPHTPTVGTYWILWGGSGTPNGIDPSGLDYMTTSGLAKYLGTTTPGQLNEKLRNNYRCPAVTDDQRASDPYKYDYVFNAQLSGMALDRIEKTSQKGMIVETDHSVLNRQAPDNTRSGFRWWASPGNTIALNHGGTTANCLFADGHVDVIDPKLNGDKTVWDAYTPLPTANPPTQPQNDPDSTNGYLPAK